MSRGVECLFYGADPGADFKNIAKVKVLDVHPVKPWVVTADERDQVVIWDYARKEAVKSFHPHHLQEQQRVLRDVQRVPAEASGGQNAFFDSRHLPSKLDTQLRDVRAVRFYDDSVLWWTCRSPGTPSPTTILQPPPDFLVILTGTRVLLVSPTTMECRHVTPDDLNGKVPTCAEIVSSSWIAIGCSDGSIWLWDWRTWKAAKVLRAHKDKLAHIINAPNPGSSWDLQASRTGPGPVHPARGHAGYDGQTNAHERKDLRLRFVSVGHDVQVLLWDLPHKDGMHGLEGDTPLMQLDGLMKSDHVQDVSYSPDNRTGGGSLTVLAGRRRPAQGDMRVMVWALGGPHSPTGTSTYVSRGGSGHVLPSIPCASFKLGRWAGGSSLVGLDHPQHPSGCLVSCGKDSVVHILAAGDVRTRGDHVAAGGIGATGASDGRGASLAHGGSGASDPASGSQDSALQGQGAVGGVGLGSGSGQGHPPGPAPQQGHGASLTALASLDLHEIVPGLPAKDRKLVKLYIVRQHPLQRHLLVCGSRVGLFVISMEPCMNHAYATHASWGDTVLRVERGVLVRRPVLGANTIGVVRVGGDKGGKASAAAVSQPSARFGSEVEMYDIKWLRGATGGFGALSAHMANPSSPGGISEHLCITPWDIKLFPHHSGRFLAVVCPGAHTYEILKVSRGGRGAPLHTGDGDEDGGLEAGGLIQGRGTAFAWLGKEAAFAVVGPTERSTGEAAGQAKPATSPGRHHTHSAGSKSKAPRVQVYTISEAGVLTSSTPDLPGVPVALYGGPVLCVGWAPGVLGSGVATQRGGLDSGQATRRDRPDPSSPPSDAMCRAPSLQQADATAGGGAAASSTALVVQFFSLAVGQTGQQGHGSSTPGAAHLSGEATGSSPHLVPMALTLPSVHSLVWDKAGCLCAVCSAGRIYVYQYAANLAPALRLVGSVSVGPAGDDQVMSMCWSFGSLYYSTASTICAVFCAGGGMERVTLASHQVRDVPGSMSWLGEDTLSPQEQCRPPGFVQVAGIVRGHLLLLGPREVYMLQLDQALPRLGMLVCAQQTGSFLPWTKAMGPEERDQACLQLERWGALAEAVRLAETSESQDLCLELCIRHGVVDDAALVR